MLNKIIDFSLHHRWGIVVAAFAIVIFGCWTTSRMEVDVFPDLTAPTVVVMTEAPGMAPEEVEKLVTYPIETNLNGSDGVRRIRSSSTNGFSVVWVEFDWNADVYHARQTVMEKLNLVSRELPANVGSPVMGPQSSILGEMLFVGLTSPTATPMELREMAEGTILPRLQSVNGVSQIAVLGGEPKEYQILVHPDKLRAYGISLAQVLEATDGMNRNVAGGSVNQYGNEYLVRGIMNVTDTEELGKAAVGNDPDGVPVLLENVADVKIGTSLPLSGDASVNGNRGVIMTITKKPDTSTKELTKALEKNIAQLKTELPDDLVINTDLYRQQDFIDSSISNIQKSLIEGAVFVVIILFLFLMNTRTVLISLVTIPLSLLVTIITLRLMDLTINTMSIGGIAIAIGSLVDDAIVDVENVYKRLRENRLLPEGKRRKVLDVVFDASKEVRMPILNSTLIIIVSFIPLFFLQGMEGRMLVPLGIAFIVSLCASTLIALTLTPVLCSMLLSKPKAEKAEPKITRWLKDGYSRMLSVVLQWPRTVIGCAVALFVVALLVFFSFGSSFLPPFNEGSYTINVSAMPGTSIEESIKVGAQAEKLLMTIPEIKNVARKTGRAELDEHALGVNTSEIEAPFELKDRSRKEFEEDIRTKLSTLPGVNIEIGQPISHRIDAMLSGTQSNIAIKIFGTDLMRMYSIGNTIKKQLEEIPELKDINVEQQIEIPQLKISPRREVLAAYGISLPDFSRQIETLLNGYESGRVNDGNRSFPIMVKSATQGAATHDDVRDLLIDAPDGSRIPLEYVAEIRSSGGPSTINRENIERKLVVSANVVPGADLGGAVEKIKKAVAENVELPEGYHIEYGGQFESQESASRVLFWTSMLSILAIFLLLFNQFRNWGQSAAVMINLPLALIGGVAAIALSSRVVSIPAIIGFISLFGVATRNGMLLVDRYNNLIAGGMSLRDAVIKGSADRLNPIIMTALTSALALIPLAAGGSLPGNEIQSPMAKVILGGLITSTALNVIVIPIVYMLITRPATNMSGVNNTTISDEKD